MMIRSNAYEDRDATDDVASQAAAEIAVHGEVVAALGAVANDTSPTLPMTGPAPLAILVADRAVFA